MTQQPPPPSPEDQADRRLRHWLAKAFPAPAPDADFRPRVWERIRAATTAPQTWSLWLQRHRAGVCCAAALCVIAGGIAGGWVASEQGSRQRERQLTYYLASIDAHLRLQNEGTAARTPR